MLAKLKITCLGNDCFCYSQVYVTSTKPQWSLYWSVVPCICFTVKCYRKAKWEPNLKTKLILAENCEKKMLKKIIKPLSENFLVKKEKQPKKCSKEVFHTNRKANKPRQNIPHKVHDIFTKLLHHCCRYIKPH